MDVSPRGAGVSGLVGHLFRRSAGQMVATLTGQLGAEHLELAEEVVQEAMLRALQVWPARGVPDNPTAWLFRVARNRAVDRLRRRTNLAAKLAALPVRSDAPAHEPDGILDDELRMIFMCCHPVLTPEARVALTLKVVGGFGVHEIARALLARPKAIAQRLVRAKRMLRERRIELEMPPTSDLPARLRSVMDVLYLMFNEGYGAHQGEDLIRRDLCQEAVRLAALLVTHTDTPELHALLALMYFQSSRLPARVDAHGALVVLADQDRSLWEGEKIARGFRHLDRSCAGEDMTVHHIEAGIAALHAAAPTYDQTDWARALQLYDQLAELTPSPVVRLNRAVALAMVHGVPAGIREVRQLEATPELADYYLLPATLGELHARSGDFMTAAACYRRAADLPCSVPEKTFLRKKVERCETAVQPFGSTDASSAGGPPRGSSR